MKSLKKVNPIVFVIVIAILVFALIGSIIVMNSKMKKSSADYETQLTEAMSIRSAVMRSGYVAITDIERGTIISDANVMYRSDIPSEADQSLFITSEDIGKMAVVDIGINTPVFTFEVSDQSLQGIHERQCNFILLNGNTKENDYVDVRILFPNGEDMIVCSKKLIKSPVPQLASCYLWLDEYDIDLLSAAIVDATIRKAEIYITKYVDPGLTKENVVTYQPPTDVIDLMGSNPNIVKESEQSLSAAARNTMEKRVDSFLENHPTIAENPPATSIYDNSGLQNSGGTTTGDNNESLDTGTENIFDNVMSATEDIIDSASGSVEGGTE